MIQQSKTSLTFSGIRKLICLNLYKIIKKLNSLIRTIQPLLLKQTLTNIYLLAK